MCKEIKEKIKKYSSRHELHDKNRPLYEKGKTLGLLDECFGESKYRKKVLAGYWTDEMLFDESKKYKTTTEFKKNNQYAYNLALKNDLLIKMTWLKKPGLTKDECFNRAKKYTSVAGFNKNDPRAYQKCLANNWLSEMTWLEPTKGTKYDPVWTFEKVVEVASECISKNDFRKKYPGAYHAAKRNGWYDKLGLPEYIIKEKVYCVYFYIWNFIKTIYVGFTYRKDERDEEHHGLGKNKKNPNKSPVYKFAVENNLPIPEPIYYAEGLTLEEAQKIEDEMVVKYTLEGWTVLNKGKTGVGIGSYGNVGIKWDYENCYNEAKKYKTSGEFYKNAPGAYVAASRNSWFKDYTWMKTGHRMGEKEAIERAKKYKTRTEFARNEDTAYNILLKNGKTVLDEIFGISKTKKLTLEECIKVAKNYKSRSDLSKGHSGIYRKLKQNNLLDILFPISTR